MTENREYKSDVFSMLMEDKNYALQVYNAVNDSNYTDPELVEMTTLERGISLSIRNDASIIVDMHLNIYEHQSTYSPNMPLRSLLYLVPILKPLIKNQDIFGRKLIKIPTPKFVVVYNGLQNRPPFEELRLSSAFEHSTDNPQLELIVSVYNINPGKNDEFLSKCKVLSEYTIFVEKVREYENAGEPHSVKNAIDWCIANGVLEDFLRLREEEVIKAMEIDMTFERREELIRRDEREEGREEGIILAKQDDIFELLEDFGSIPDELTDKIRSITDLEKLKLLHKFAAKASSIEAFEANL